MSRHDYSPGGKLPAVIWRILLGAALFSGFGQMPITKRYYIADLPLMGWAADFFVVSTMHYLSAALILFMLAWRLVLSRGLLDQRWSWGPRAKWTFTLLALLIISGAFKAVRNTGFFLPPALLVILDFMHLGSAMAMLITMIASLFRSKPLPQT